jgi:P2 phage tail completion protein R (GpR)
MRKPDALRTWLLRAVPGLKDQAERLHLWIEKSRIHCNVGETLSYETRYELIVTIENFAHDSDKFIVPILSWLSHNQPDLLRNTREDGLPMFHDILDNKTADIEIKLALKERAIVTQTPQGGWRVEYPSEPTFPETFVGAEGARLLKLYLVNPPAEAELVAEHSDLPD